MHSRERVRAVLAGEVPDRPPVALGFSGPELSAVAPPDEADRYRVDVRFLSFRPSPAQAEFEKYVRAFPRDTRIGRESLLRTYHEWGYRPAVHETNPLADLRDVSELEDYPWPTLDAPERTEGLAAEVKRLQHEGYAVAGNLPHLGGELFETGWRLRGFSAFLLDLLERPQLAEALLDRLTRIAEDNAARMAATGVDILVLDDDVGMPGGMIISPSVWRRYLRPRLAQVIAAARLRAPRLRVLYHSDGVITPILGDLFEIGVDAVNPVQPDRMDPLTIRRLAPAELTLWGTLGTPTSWSYGSPEEVAAEVELRWRTLGPRRLVLAPAYDVDEPDVPWANLRAFLEAAEALA